MFIKIKILNLWSNILKLIVKIKTKMIINEKSLEKSLDYQIRLYSKKLVSGKCQVKFYLSTQEGTKYYGYVLAEGKDTVSQVVARIHRCITDRNENHQSIYNSMLLKQKPIHPSSSLLLLENKNWKILAKKIGMYEIYYYKY